MLKEKKSAIGDLIILLKSQIIWDSKGQDPIVSVEQAGEPCYNYVQEQHAKYSVTGKRTRAHLELSHPHQREDSSSFKVLALMVAFTASADASQTQASTKP